jgi:DNA-binding NtrC family response regulator
LNPLETMMYSPFTPATFLLCEGPPPDFPGDQDGPALPIRKRKHRILIVDDERLIADTLCEILNGHGFEATAFYDGKSALSHSASMCPDTIISDVIMPELDGIEMAKSITSRCPRTKIILFSGQAATTNLLKRAHVEGYDFELLAKPIHPDTLLRKLGDSRGPTH